MKKQAKNAKRPANSRTPCSSNAVVRNAIAAVGSSIEAANALATARNADAGANKDDIIKWEIGRISARIKKRTEDYAYWMEAHGSRFVDGLMSWAVKLESKGRLSPSIIAEIKKLRKRVDDAIAASKRLQR